MAEANEEMVLVSKKRLEALEALEVAIPAMLEAAKKEGGMERLKLLHQKQRENPEKHREHCRKQYQENKDKRNAKRREAYRLKKEAEKSPVTVSAH
jgi:hypothetical protein